MIERIKKVIDKRTRRLRSPLGSLVVAVGLVAAVWLIVLPGIAKRPAIRERVEWLNEKGIDPNAMYYTDLEMMDELLVRQRAAKRTKRLGLQP